MCSIGALIIRKGLWGGGGRLYYIYNKEPQNPIRIIKASILVVSGLRSTKFVAFTGNGHARGS